MENTDRLADIVKEASRFRKLIDLGHIPVFEQTPSKKEGMSIRGDRARQNCTQTSSVGGQLHCPLQAYAALVENSDRRQREVSGGSQVNRSLTSRQAHVMKKDLV